MSNFQSFWLQSFISKNEVKLNFQFGLLPTTIVSGSE